MSEQDMQAIAERLAAIRDIILDREGEDTQDQFEIGNYIIVVNIEGNGYMDAEDEANQTLFTLIQVEKGPLGMEELVATAVEQFSNDNESEADSFILGGEQENLLEILDEVAEKVYRHWHWLDMPNALPGSVEEEEDDFDDEEDF